MKKKYMDAYDKKWNRCIKIAKTNPDCDDISLEATEIFEETANADEIAGYYIVMHGSAAYKDWCDNVSHLRESGRMSEKDLEIDEILRKVYVSGAGE